MCDVRGLPPFPRTCFGILMFFLSSVLVLSGSLWGRNLYVDNLLSSDCPGTTYSILNRDCSGNSGLGFQSIQAAENQTQPGDKVLIRAGTYLVRMLFRDQGGTAAAPVIYRPYGNERVVIKFPPVAYPWDGKQANFRLKRGIGHLVFEGLEFDGDMEQNCTGECFDDWQTHPYHVAILSLGQDSAGNHVTVKNCKIHDYAHAAIKGNLSWVIEFNQIYNIGTTRWDHGAYFSDFSSGVVRYNQFSNISGSGLHIYGHSPSIGNWKVHNNIFQNYGARAHDGAAILADANDIEVYGNIFNTGDYGILGYCDQECNDGTGPRRDGFVVKNNIFMNNSVCDIALSNKHGPNHVFTNNIYLSPLICKGCKQAQTEHIDDIPPNFRLPRPPFASDPPYFWTDYVQVAGDYADVGATLGSQFQQALDPQSSTWPPNLVDQNSFGSGWEIGPFVFRGNSNSTPSSPSNLRILSAISSITLYLSDRPHPTIKSEFGLDRGAVMLSLPMWNRSREPSREHYPKPD